MKARFFLILLFLLLSALGLEPAYSAARASAGGTPLSFEPNLGQTDPQVKYLARGPGYTLFLTPGEAVLVFQQGRGAGRSTTAVRMRLVGATSTPELGGLDLLPGKSNYFIGNDPRKWRTGVPHYGRVRHRDVYPGIDLVYYGNQERLEYDFVVAPGGDPTRIELAFDGADGLELDALGNLILRAGGGELRLHRPVVYQEVDAVRREVAGGYMLTDEGRVGIRLAAYDRSRPLIVDPVLTYSTFLGSLGNDIGHGIAVDAAGHVYVTGSTTSATFPTAPTFPRFLCGLFRFLCPFQRRNAGASDVFVTKLRPDGSGLVYSTYLGGTGNDEGLAIAVDAAGNAYVTGRTASNNFPVAPCVTAAPPSGGAPGPMGCFPITVQPSLAGGTDAFVAKLNRDGSALVYSTFLGGSGDDVGNGIAVDFAGNAHVAGQTDSTNFPTTSGALDTTCGTDGACDFDGISHHADAFVTKVNATGSALLYSTYLGGKGDDVANGIVLDTAGNAYVTGRTASDDFPRTPGAFQTSYGGGLDAFVTKLNATGSALVYSTFLGGTAGDIGNGIAVDAAGHAYVTGYTGSADFPVADPFQANYGGFRDAFVTKLDLAGSALVYSTFLGGIVGSSDGLGDIGNAIAVDAGGNAYVTGRTVSRDDPAPPITTPGNEGFPMVRPFQPMYGGGYGDAFVVKLNPIGTVTYSTYLGGSEWDEGLGIAVDASGNAYVTDQTASITGFPLVNPYQGTNHLGPFEAFVTKIAGKAPGLADLVVTKTASPEPTIEGSPLTYTVTVTNYGPDPATAVTLIETLSPEVTFVSFAVSPPTQGTCSVQGAVVVVGKTVICNLGNLAKDAKATVTIVVTPNKRAP